MNKKKNQNKQENTPKLVQTTQFKKKSNNNKGKGGCFVCGSDQHWARECPDRKVTQDKKSANVVTTETEDGTSGYGNSLLFVHSVCNSPEWWMDGGANIHVCADVSLFSSYQVGNGSRAHVLGVGTVILKFTSGKTVPLKSVQHVPSIKKNLVSVSIVEMATKLFLSQINVLCRNMVPLVVKDMIAEACSAYLCMMSVIKW